MNLRAKGLGKKRIIRELERLGKTHLRGVIENWIYHGAKPFQFSLVTQLKEGHETLTVDKAYLIGVLCGDGCVTTGYRIVLSVTDEDFVKKFIYVLDSVYGLKASITTKQRTAEECNLELKNEPKLTYIAVAVSKNACLDLWRYSSSYYTEDWDVPVAIILASAEIKAAFLRGLFDSEGTARLKKKGHAMLQLGSSNLSSLLIIKAFMFKEYQINFWQGYNNTGIPILRVERYKDIKTFADHIGFSIKRKQDNLEAALASYKRKGLRKYSKEFKLQALALYDQGFSTYEVGKMMGFQYTNLHDFIKQRAKGRI